MEFCASHWGPRKTRVSFKNDSHFLVTFICKSFLVEFLYVVLSNNGRWGAANTQTHNSDSVFVKAVSQRVMGLCSSWTMWVIRQNESRRTLREMKKMEEASRWVRRCWCCCSKEEENEENRRESEEEVKIEEVCLRKSRSSLSLPPAQVCALIVTPSYLPKCFLEDFCPC